MMKRREFLTVSAGLLVAAGSGLAREEDVVMTVRGPISPEEMGATLAHEHVLVDFIGAEKVNRNRYNADEVFETALPYLNRVKELGCRTLVECTPAYLGRDPRLLQRLSEASGLHLLTNTGYYGAAGDKFVPKHAYAETADQLADRWTREWEEGIEDTGIKPGFIKIGVDDGPLSEIDKKLVTAAARAHGRTGLTVAAHTGNGKAALEEIDIFRREGVSPSAFIWVHAQNEKDPSVHAQAADAGAWVSLDGIGPGNLNEYVQFVVDLRERGFRDRILLSHDAGWYHVGEPSGGEFRPYDTLFREFVPRLKENGFSDTEVEQLTVRNPHRAFAIRVKKTTKVG